MACRILQGISTCIEAPLSTSHAVELVPEGREGYVAGIMSFSVNIGILLAGVPAGNLCRDHPVGRRSPWWWRWGSANLPPRPPDCPRPPTPIHLPQMAAKHSCLAAICG